MVDSSDDQSFTLRLSDSDFENQKNQEIYDALQTQESSQRRSSTVYSKIESEVIRSEVISDTSNVDSSRYRPTSCSSDSSEQLLGFDKVMNSPILSWPKNKNERKRKVRSELTKNVLTSETSILKSDYQKNCPSSSSVRPSNCSNSLLKLKEPCNQNKISHSRQVKNNNTCTTFEKQVFKKTTTTTTTTTTITSRETTDSSPRKINNTNARKTNDIMLTRKLPTKLNLGIGRSRCIEDYRWVKMEHNSRRSPSSSNEESDDSLPTEVISSSNKSDNSLTTSSSDEPDFSLPRKAIKPLSINKIRGSHHSKSKNQSVSTCIKKRKDSSTTEIYLSSSTEESEDSSSSEPIRPRIIQKKNTDQTKPINQTSTKRIVISSEESKDSSDELTTFVRNNKRKRFKRPSYSSSDTEKDFQVSSKRTTISKSNIWSSGENSSSSKNNSTSGINISSRKRSSFKINSHLRRTLSNEEKIRKLRNYFKKLGIDVSLHRYKDFWSDCKMNVNYVLQWIKLEKFKNLDDPVEIRQELSTYMDSLQLNPQLIISINKRVTRSQTASQRWQEFLKNGKC